MGAEGSGRASHEASTLRDYLRVVRRRRWVILQAAVLVPVAALVVSFRQEPLYEASAEVLLNRHQLALSLTGTSDPSAQQQPDRALQTQADLGEVPEVARRVLAATHVDRTVEELLDHRSVTAKKNADLLVFSVADRSAKLAVRLATAYASEFTAYHRELQTASLRQARNEIQARIDELERRGDRESALYSSLVEKEQQIRTVEALQAANAVLVRPASEAERVRPQPKRNALLGLMLGLVLGVGLAFLWEALDTRVRSTNEIARRLGLPLLARIPQPPRWMQRTNRLVMLTEPNSVQAEPFRMLRTNFDFFNLEHGARTVMVTSAVGQEGKSTTVANLAVALSRAGQRVILVDVDLRRAILHRFFNFDDGPGLTDVALGRAQLGPVSLPDPAEAAPTQDRQIGPQGSLHVLTAGLALQDAGEFAGSQALADVLADLRERADVVLIDAPPLLVVGDAMALSAQVDGLIVVARLNAVRRPMVDEVRRVLDTCPAVKLGFVVTAAETEEDYGYGYGTYYYRRTPAVERERLA